MTPETTRYPMQDFFVADQITLLSLRSAKYPSESDAPWRSSSFLICTASAAPSRPSGLAGRRNKKAVTTTVTNPSAPISR
jgi:hypothetical protein